MQSDMTYLFPEAYVGAGLWLSAASCAILAAGYLLFSRWRNRPFANLPFLKSGNLQHQRIVLDEAYNKVSISWDGARLIC
jgi:hypothetical protein